MAGKKLPKLATGCRPSQLFGVWYMEPERLQQYKDRVDAIDLVALAESNAKALKENEGEVEQANSLESSGDQPVSKPYQLIDGIAIITISGPTTKYRTSFQSVIGGTSTVAVMRQLRQAANDPDVRGILMHFDDAPGGTVAGAYELRDDIREAAKKKPMRAHVSDLATSAGYLFASSCGFISANETAFIGSIGTRTHLTDRSKQFENDGVKVIPVDSGKYKSLGLPGTPITEDQVKEVQSHIDGMNDIFITSIVENRKLSAETIRAMEARIYIAGKAIELKLSDQVCSFEQAFSNFAESIDAADVERREQNDRSMTMNLLEQCRVMFAQPTMNEADAITRLTAMQTDLTNARAAIPKPMDAELRDERFSMAMEKIDLAVEKSKIPAASAQALKEQCGWRDPESKTPKQSAPNEFMLAKRPELGGKSVTDFTLSMFDGVEVKGPKVVDGKTTSEKTGAAATLLKRDIPGGDDDKERQEQVAGGESAVEKYMKARNIPVAQK